MTVLIIMDRLNDDEISNIATQLVLVQVRVRFATAKSITADDCHSIQSAVVAAGVALAPAVEHHDMQLRTRGLVSNTLAGVHECLSLLQRPA
jgi:hypothetical protein